MAHENNVFDGLILGVQVSAVRARVEVGKRRAWGVRGCGCGRGCERRRVLVVGGLVVDGGVGWRASVIPLTDRCRRKQTW